MPGKSHTKQKRKSRVYKGGEQSLPVFTPKNLNTFVDQTTSSLPTLPKPSIKLPPLTSDMAMVEHNQQPTMFDICGNKSTLEHIGDSISQIVSHPQVVNAKNALVEAVSNVISGVKKTTNMEGGKKKSRRNGHKKRKSNKTKRMRRVRHN